MDGFLAKRPEGPIIPPAREQGKPIWNSMSQAEAVEPECGREPAVALIWELDGKTFRATSFGPNGEPRFHLVVEPDGEWWKWTVTRAGKERGAAAQHGRTVSRQGAMWDAERACRSAPS